MSAGSGWTSAMGAREFAAVWAKSADGFEFEVGDAPVEASAEEAEGVALGGERDGAVAVGALLAVDAKADLGGGGVIDAMAECVACGLACEQWSVAGGAQDVGGAEFAEAAAQQMFGGGLGCSEGFVDVAGEAHGGGAVEDVGAALLVGTEAELGVVLEAAEKDVVEELGELAAVAWDDARGVGVDVVLEVAAEEAGAVPGEIACAGLQEEADALDGTHAEDEVVGVDEDFASLLGADAECADGFVLEEELDGVGVQPDLEVVAGLECFGCAGARSWARGTSG